MASKNNYYVTSPIGSDYEGVSEEAISRGIDFSKRSHRMLSGKGEYENRYDGGSTGFKYVEDTMFSTKNVKFVEADLPMTEVGFINSIKDREGCVYKVIKFDRSYNIRAFDFIITYTQLSDWQSKTYKAIPVRRQFRGSLLFTGCSIVRDTDTMEELPLKLYAKYESIGDTVGESVDINGKVDTKGGPAIGFSYTYDSNYVYVYISSISPFRLIPSGDGEFKDISYLENSGTLIGETKENVHVIKDPATGVKKTEPYSRNKTLWCDLSIALRDQTTTHTNADSHFVNYSEVPDLSSEAYKEKTTNFILVPTNDGEEMVIGMAPDSDVGLEIAQDNKPIRFGSRLLSTDMDKVNEYINSLMQKIKAASINTEKTPFTIKTVIRTRGKYNIKGEYFIDDQADSYGQIVIQDVGIYDVISDSFDITEYITDKNTLQTYSANTVANYKKYINNASEYLSEISNGKVYPHVRKTNKLLEVLSNINFEAPNSLDVYSDVAYIRAPVTFEVVAAYAEFGPDETINTDDKIIYICKDGKIRVCGFKDYEMDNIEVYDIFGEYLPTEISRSTYVTKVDRAWTGDHYIYCLGTNNGIYALIEGITEGEMSVEIKDAFIENTSDGEFSSGEEVVYLKSDNEYFYIGGEDGSIRIINIDNLASSILPLHFTYGDKIRYAELISDDTILFISSLEACTYNLYSEKWNFEGDDYRLNAKFWNPYGGSLEKPNIDLIIDENGWENVPVIQVGQFVYALGLRNDTSGYVPVYKKLDTLTGEVVTLPEPQRDHKTYKSQLCKEGNLIYVIGGTNPDAGEIIEPSQLKNLISVFDTTSDTWVEFSEFILTNNNEKRVLVSPNFHPIVYNNKMYLIRPKVLYLNVNEITGLYTSSEKYDDNMYIVDITTKTSEHVEIELPEEAAKENIVNINIVPVIAKSGMIMFLAGLRNVTYDASTDVYTFNGYNLYRIILNTFNNSVTYTTQLINSKELAANYIGNNANNARSDIFSYYSMLAEYNEVLIYCLDCEAIIYARLDVPYAEVHMAYHNLEDHTFYPTITEGEYVAWNTYGITPGNVALIHIGNFIAFLGGTASRVNGYLDLSVISWVPAPRFMERRTGNPNTAILTPSSNALSIVSNENNIVNQISSCKIDNIEYLLTVKKNESEYAVVLYKYDLDDPSAKLTFVKDLTTHLVSNKYVNGFTNYTITPLGKDAIAIAPFIGYDNTGYVDDPFTKFNVFIYDLTSRTITHVINDLEREEDMVGNIYALEGENKVIYTVKNGPSYTISKVNREYVYEMSRSIDYVGDLHVNYTPKILDHIIPTVRRGKFALAAEPFEEAIVIHKFDTIDGTESVNENSFLYTIDNSADYNNPQLYLNGNDLYLTKGCKNTTLNINDVNYTNKSFSTEIIKLKFNEAAGLTPGSDNDRMHALLSTNTSGIYAPFAISRNDNIIVFGEPRVDVTRGSRYNVDIRFIPLKGKISKDTFVDIDTHVTLTGASRSQTNRYKPVMKTIHANGHELVLVFGGTASPESSITKTLDVYDTARHIWSRICDLPEYISHVSTKDNVILGGTTEILRDGTQRPYTTRLEINCTDYDTLSFEIKFKRRPDSDLYPTYGKWAEADGLDFVIPMNSDESPKREPIVKIINNESVSTIEPIEASIIYNGNYRIVGSFIANGNLVMVLFNKASFEISFWKNINDVWTKVTYIEEPNRIDITEKAYAFEISDETFTSIQNGKVFEAKAILAYVDPAKVNSKGVLVSYITVDDEGTISVTPKPETFAYIPGDDLSAVDSVEISKDGFTYYSKNNVTNGEVRRIFPNNNSLGFGCRRLEAKDSETNVKTRAVSNNIIYSIYYDNRISKINLDTNDKTVYDGVLDIIGNSSIICSKIIDNRIYLVCSEINENEETSYRLVSVDLNDITKTCEKDIHVNSLNKPYFLRDHHRNSFTIILDANIVDHNIEIKYIVVNINDNGFEIESKHIINPTDSNYEDILVINENIDLLLKNKRENYLYLRSVNGLIENIVSVPTDVNFCKVDNNTIYGADSNGKVYEIVVKNYKVMSSGYTYSTIDFINNISDDVIIRNSDMIIFEKGYRYIHPSTIDFNHYCYDNIDIDHDINTSFEDKVVSIGVNNEDSESYVVYTSEKETHIVKTRNVVIDSNGETVKNIPIGTKSTMFVDKINGTIHLYIADPANGKIYNINTLTGVTNITETELGENKKINAIKVDSNKNVYVLHSNKFALYNTKTSEIDYKDFGSNVELKLILKIDPYFKKIRALFKKTNDNNNYYFYGIFNGGHFDLESSSLTDIPTEYDKIEYISDDSIFISNDNNNVIEVKISTNGASAEVIKFIPDYYKYFDTVADKPLIKFTGNVVSGNTLRTGEFKFKDVIFNNHSAIYKNKKFNDIFDGFVINVLQYKDLYLVVDSLGHLVICNFDKQDFKIIDSEIVQYLNPENRNIVCVETEKYKDTLTGITHFGQIVSIGQDDVKLISIDSTNDVENITSEDDTLTLSELDITENLIPYNLNLDCVLVKTNSNTVTMYPKDNVSNIGILIMSPTYGIPSVVTEINIPVENNYIIFKLADYTFIVNKNTHTCTVISTGTNGIRKTICNGFKELSFNLSNTEIEMFNNIPTGIYYGTNERMCDIIENECNIYFNPMKNVSEYYSKYIGVDSIGNVYDVEVPISNYDISSLGIMTTSDFSENTPIRSEGNILAIPYIVYKSSNKNIVARIPIVTRLNTAKFVKDYDTTEDLSTGEIYAFLPSTLNGTLIRDDASFYQDKNVVSIINNSTIKIKVDGVWNIYSRADNSIPLTGTILPIVMAYGTRTDNTGLSDSKYYAFIDNTGNVSTYDKELKSFVDIAGNVTVKVPFFSSQAMILPSIASEKNNQAVEVWAYSDQNPYEDIEDKSTGFVTDFARINNELLK